MSVPHTPEGSLLDAAATAPAVDIEAIAPEGTILVITPHPDDETFGCGMAMAAAAASHRRIAIVLLTDGEASHPASRSHTREQRIAVRSEEFAKALQILVPTQKVDVLRLRLPDGRSGYDPALLEQLIPQVCDREIAAVWSTWHGDPHCDHQTAGKLGSALARTFEVPFWAFAVWGRFGDQPVPPSLSTFHDPGVAAQKRKAIAAYQSQINAEVFDDPDGFVMPSALQAHFANHPEIFINVI